jgi:hypothetical protein
MMKLAAFLLLTPMLLGFRVLNLRRDAVFCVSRSPLGATTARGSLDEGDLGMSGRRFIITRVAKTLNMRIITCRMLTTPALLSSFFAFQF